MKKIFVGAVALLAAGYLGLSGIAWYHDTLHAESAAAQPVASAETAQIRDILNRNACYYCHSATAALPPYASLPGIRQLSQYDIDKGQRYFRLDALFNALRGGSPPGQADLAKLERVVTNDTMPPMRFRLVHWSTGLSQHDQQTLLTWIAHQRKRWYVTPGVAAAFENEPVQPLPQALPTDPRKVALGMQLFHDPRLSVDNSLSCASCHSLSTGGVDNRKRSLGVRGQLGGVNAPTVFNAALNHMQFWDGRAATLQEQAGGPPLNPVEMASASWQQIVGKLNADPSFAEAFVKVYPDGLSGPNITDAIAEFEKTLLTPSRFDAWLRGNTEALSREEVHGYQLFKSTGCASCHVGANLGGQSFERMGRAGDYFAARGDALTEADNGRANVTHDPRDRQWFKVPGLRNVALTAPYFHDGSVTDLREAVRKMAQYQLGTTLSEADVDALTAFLKSLTGTYAPPSAPMSASAPAPSPAFAAQP